MPSLASASMNSAIPIAASSSPLSHRGASDEHLSMEHLTRSEVFAKKPLQCLSPADGSINNESNVELPFKLLPGEYARWYSTLRNGLLITLTNFRLFVLLENGGKCFYNIPIQSIDTVECRDMFYLQVSCKDGRVAKITFENNESCLNWLRLLNSAIVPSSKLDDIFAFAFYAWCKEEKGEQELSLRSLDVYLHSDIKFTDYHDDDDRMVTEFEFSRLEFDPKIWRISELNSDYRFCSTYPRYWIVPLSITDQEIESAGRYRSMRRVPAVVWRHRTNGAALVRCSQPESGIFGWRSPADEKLLRAIMLGCASQNSAINGVGSTSTSAAGIVSTETSVAEHISGIDTASANPKSMLILDARSYTAAWANRAKGGGFESVEYYQNCEINFLGLANIHGIRYSFQKLRSLCWETPETNWFQNLEACQWINHLCSLLSSAVRVAEAIHIDGRPVLVHCSDGWDRTTQIVSLAKLFLDSHYRTMKGFKELIEREWIGFGHKFAERSGTTAGDVNQRAPVFLQWLDCVHYVLKENPCAFEFNETYLIKLAQHVYSGLFGTFLCNSMAEYIKANVASRTFSIWSFLHPENCQFRNVLYTCNTSQCLLPRLQVRDLADIWRSVYCPPNDPANSRPRSLSSASMEGDHSALRMLADKQAATVKKTLSTDKSLTRTLSCDNVATSISPTSSSKDLGLLMDKTQGSLHRTGSDSSLTMIGGFNGAPNQVSNNVDKDAEQILRSLVDQIDKSTRASISDTKEYSNATTEIGNGDIADSVIDHLQPSLYSLLDTSTTTVVDQPTQQMDIGTSTSDLCRCCSVIEQLSVNTYPRDAVCRRHGFWQPNECPKAPVASGKSVVGQLCDGDNIKNGTYKLPLGSDAYGLDRPVAKRKCEYSPKDMIDSDGMTRVPDAAQQRVREIIENYETHLENLTMEMECLRLRLQCRNGCACVCGDRKKHLSAEEFSDALEPHSFGSRGSASDTSWDNVEERETKPVLYVPDHFSPRCMRCDSVFTVINRRHHCRSCGKLVCNACSNYESSVPHELFYDPVRVCRMCYTNLRGQDPPLSPQVQQQQTHHDSLPQQKVSA